MKIRTLMFEHRPINEHLVLMIEGKSLDEHADSRGELIECADDNGQPLHAAFVFSDALKAVVACVFNVQFWTKAQATKWLKDHFQAAQSQAVALITQARGLPMSNGKQPISGGVQKPQATRRFVGGKREAEARRILREFGVEAVRTSLAEHGEALDQFSPGFQSDFLVAEVKEYAYSTAGIVDSADVAALVERVKGAGSKQTSSNAQAAFSASQADVQQLVDRVRGRNSARRDVADLVERVKPGAVKE